MKALRIGALGLAMAGGLSPGTMAFAKGHHHHAKAKPAEQYCQLVLVEYCVAEQNGARHIAWTNTCLAQRQGIKIIKLGACS